MQAAQDQGVCGQERPRCHDDPLLRRIRVHLARLPDRGGKGSALRGGQVPKVGTRSRHLDLADWKSLFITCPFKDSFCSLACGGFEIMNQSKLKYGYESAM